MKNHWLEKSSADGLVFVVNGKKYFTYASQISYESVLFTAALPNFMYSMTYHDGVDGDMGILHAGQSVDLKNNMIFTVAFTGNA